MSNWEIHKLYDNLVYLLQGMHRDSGSKWRLLEQPMDKNPRFIWRQ